MTNLQATNKAELLAQMDRTWNAFITTLDKLTPEQMIIHKDPQGWTIKDHLCHLTIWERSEVSLLQGRPRHEALGVEETLYLTGTEDEINAVIQQQHKNISLEKALAQLRVTHQELVGLLQTLPDQDLQKLYHHFLPNEISEEDGTQELQVAFNNIASHFAEHHRWIQALIDHRFE